MAQDRTKSDTAITLSGGAGLRRIAHRCGGGGSTKRFVEPPNASRVSIDPRAARGGTEVYKSIQSRGPRPAPTPHCSIVFHGQNNGPRRAGAPLPSCSSRAEHWPLVGGARAIVPRFCSLQSYTKLYIRPALARRQAWQNLAAEGWAVIGFARSVPTPPRREGVLQQGGRAGRARAASTPPAVSSLIDAYRPRPLQLGQVAKFGYWPDHCVISPLPPQLRHSPPHADVASDLEVGLQAASSKRIPSTGILPRSPVLMLAKRRPPPPRKRSRRPIGYLLV